MKVFFRLLFSFVQNKNKNRSNEETCRKVLFVWEDSWRRKKASKIGKWNNKQPGFVRIHPFFFLNRKMVLPWFGFCYYGFMQHWNFNNFLFCVTATSQQPPLSNNNHLSPSFRLCSVCCCHKFCQFFLPYPLLHPLTKLSLLANTLWRQSIMKRPSPPLGFINSHLKLWWTKHSNFLVWKVNFFYSLILIAK